MNLQRTIAAMQRLSETATRAAFATLDYRLAETPLEDQPERSWEVEREEFLRRLASDEEGQR